MLTRKVMVATDFSETADLALIEAHERAGPAGAVLVCYARAAWSPPTPPGAASSPRESRAAADLRETVAARMIKTTGRAPDQFSVSIENDEPYAAIVKRAEAWRASLLVVGYRGATGLARVWLGGVAEKVARLAHCPVLIARPKSGTRRIVVGTDFSNPALPAIHAACDEARRIDGTVILAHSLEMPMMLPDGAGLTGAEGSGALIGRLEVDAKQKLKAAMDECRVPGESRLTLEPPSIALVRLAEAVEADLLVVGTRGRTGLRRILLGSVAEAVARLAGCSVLVVRLREAPSLGDGN
jgi:nucleotide-binding universal stress UspA family protein